MKPDAEQFARAVLWHLAGVRAETAAIEIRLAVIEARLAGAVPSDTTAQAWAARTAQRQQELYQEALRSVGLPDSSPPPSPPRAGPDIP